MNTKRQYNNVSIEAREKLVEMLLNKECGVKRAC